MGIIYLTPSIFWRMVRREIEVAPMSTALLVEAANLYVPGGAKGTLGK